MSRDNILHKVRTALGRSAGQAVAELLCRADGFYASGDRGLAARPVRCAIAIRAARHGRISNREFQSPARAP